MSGVRRWSVVVVLGLFGLGVGCSPGAADFKADGGSGVDVSSGGDGEAATDGASAEGPSWYGEVRGIVGENCVQCHREGGIGPFPMAEYEEAKAVAKSALDAMENGRMPPWQPDPDCRRFEDERLIAQSEIETFRRWVETGMSKGEGDGKPAEAPEADALPDADIVAKPSGAYKPPKSQTDTYRCFLLDHTFAEDTYGTASWVVPDKTPIVHHVLAYVVEPEDAKKMEKKAKEDSQPGFDCFGATSGGPIGWYVPGTEPRNYQNDRGFLLPKDSRIMMQVHYNVLSADPKPDRTTLHLATREKEPDQYVTTNGIPHTGIEIPAGEAHSEHTKTITNNSENDWVIKELAGHMHLLGKSIKLEKVTKDGSKECLLDIPDWDFEWQQFYSVREGEEIHIKPGESLKMTCVYDNSPANQPTVDGEQISTRAVDWGPGTLDEMCLSYISTLSDSRPGGGGGTSPSEACKQFPDCRSKCSDGNDYSCLFACSFDEAGCGQCLIGAFYGQNGCVRDSCGQKASAVTPCFESCRKNHSGGDAIVSCMENNCGADWSALEQCVSAEVAAGSCDKAIASCRP